MYLGFERASRTAGGRRLRRSRFEARSNLPVSAACVVANGVREMLTSQLGTAVALRLLEPRIPDTVAWNAILCQARVFRVRGTLGEAAFVLRPGDALNLAAGAFGEEGLQARALSPLESEVLERAMRALAPALSPICGSELESVESGGGTSTYVTYFEMLVERPFALRLGVALPRDPQTVTAGTCLRIEDLLAVHVEARVTLGLAALGAREFLRLHPGASLPMTSTAEANGELAVGGVVMARGECGAFAGRYAMTVRA